MFRYCVRPNSGRIDPSRSVEVQVLLQAMKEDPPLDARCRDKFLVQSVAVPTEHESTNVAQIWHSIESTAKGSIQEKKIRVTFLSADSTSGGQTNGVHEDDHAAPPAYSSPSPMAVTPQRSSGTQGPVSTIDQFRPEGARSLGDAKDSAYNPAMSNSNATTSVSGSTLSNTAAAVTNAIPTSSDDIRRQLDEAKAQISRLQTQATEGLRQRNVVGEKGDKSVTGGMAEKMQSVPAGGVSVPVVAGLCLLCFLIAYFFF
jgi:hypothetical protein